MWHKMVANFIDGIGISMIQPIVMDSSLDLKSTMSINLSTMKITGLKGVFTPVVR